MSKVLLTASFVLTMIATLLLSVAPASAQTTQFNGELVQFANGLNGPQPATVLDVVLTDTDLVRGNNATEIVRLAGASFGIFDSSNAGDFLVRVTFSDGTTVSNVEAVYEFASSNFGGSTRRYLLDQAALGGRSLADVTEVQNQRRQSNNLNWDDLGFSGTSGPPTTQPPTTQPPTTQPPTTQPPTTQPPTTQPPTTQPPTTQPPTTQPPAAADGTVLFSLTGNQGGFANEDIIEYDPATGQTSVLFDGSDVGLSRLDVEAFAEMADGSLLLTLDRDVRLGGTTVRRNDILRFSPTSLGSRTASNFSVFLDSSDVGLSTSGERIDAIEVVSEDGDITLAISTLGSIRVSGVSGSDEDLSLLTLTRTGTTSRGTWARYFDGSDLGLGSSSEDLKAAAVIDGEVRFATLGSFSASGASGNASNTVSCTGFSAGSNTSCDGLTVNFNLSDAGLSGAGIDGLDVRS